MSTTLHSELVLALELADEADAITMARFRSRDLRVETKPDLTPVSDADRAVEDAIRRRLDRDRPADAVLGEERGAAGEASRCWILDPIDGTKSFVRGVPVWATLLALEVEGAFVLGVASAPALGRRWWAIRGGGAFADGDPIRVSKVAALADAHVAAPNERELDEDGLGDGYRAITRRCWRAVGYADFWGHVLVAEGALDVMVEHTVERWDIAALRPIVEEAGGCVTDLDGVPWTTRAPCVTTNGLLHDEVLAALRSPAAPPSHPGR
jgi:histidinol-phosphatase